ncbi:MAG: YheC/YheD family protein [Clostridia bacterium]|nr:YheC/YheD family protein [Clostridia bacterium]
MDVFKVTVQRVARWQQEQIGISTGLHQELGLVSGDYVILKLGRWRKKVRWVTTVSNNSYQISLSGRLIQETGLVPGWEIKVRYYPESNVLAIGPMMGIFAMIKHKNNGISFGEQGLFFRELAAASRSSGVLLYVFSSADINWLNGRIEGYVHQPGPGRGQWIKGSFPFPNAIYDRIISWHLAPEDYEAKCRLRSLQGIIMFNPHMGDKWHFHTILAGEREIASFLPETQNFVARNGLAEWFKHFSEIYIKPRLGSQGKGIIKINRFGKKGYLFQLVQQRGQQMKVVFPTLQQLEKGILNIINGKRCLIQQGLALALWQGRVFDIRVLTQKNGQGIWMVTGMACRIGKKESIVSNVHGGGRAVTVDTVLGQLFGRKPGMVRHILNQVKSLSIKVSEKIEQYHGLVGELGIDVGVDKNGGVWLIEVNPKPGRSVFRRLGDIAARKRAVDNPVAYINYLSGFDYSGK